jgi:hypothetical protein
MGRPLKKPQVPEKELESQFFIPDHAGSPLFLVDSKGEILWKALPDDWKAAKEVELVKLLVSEYGVRQFIRFQGQWADEETGFYYNRHRSTTLCQADSIGLHPVSYAAKENKHHDLATYYKRKIIGTNGRRNFLYVRRGSPKI